MKYRAALTDMSMTTFTVLMLCILVVACVSVMIWAQRQDVERVRNDNVIPGHFGLGYSPDSSFSTAFGSVIIRQFGAPVKSGEEKNQAISAIQENSFPANVVSSTKKDWGTLVVTDVIFTPSTRVIQLDATYLPSDFARQVISDSYEPLQLAEAYTISPSGTGLRRIELNVEDSRLALKMNNANGGGLWPYDSYNQLLFVVLHAPARVGVFPDLRQPVDETAVLFGKGVEGIEPGNIDEVKGKGIRILPISVGVKIDTKFSAPEGYVLETGAATETTAGIAPVWIIKISQRNLLPKVGIIVVGLLFLAVILLAGWRAVNGGSPLEISAITLALVFGTSLVSDITGEPTLQWPSWVDILKLYVIIGGLSIVGVNLYRSITRTHGSNK